MIKPPKAELPKLILPWEWKPTRIFGAYQSSKTGLIVLRSMENRDGDDWLHVSLSHQKKMPTYKEVAMVKKLFIGEDKNAYMVFPRSDRHVNQHQYCLHLWCNISNPQPLPEFSNTLFGERSI